VNNDVSTFREKGRVTFSTEVEMRWERRTLDPTEARMLGDLETILADPKAADFFPSLPDVDFLLSYVEDSLEYWLLRIKGLGMEDSRVNAILEKIELQERLGKNLGFSLDNLHAMRRAIAWKVQRFEEPKKTKEIEAWLSRVRGAKKAKERNQKENLKELV
jgi:hypothetical protein